MFYTIDNENNITVFATPEEAAAASPRHSIRSPHRMSWGTGKGLASGTIGRNLEQPARRHAGQEVQGPDDGRYSDLEEYPIWARPRIPKRHPHHGVREDQKDGGREQNREGRVDPLFEVDLDQTAAVHVGVALDGPDEGAHPLG